jgi:hypothetical protein
MLGVIMLTVVMLTVVILTVVTVMLSVNMAIVKDPFQASLILKFKASSIVFKLGTLKLKNYSENDSKIKVIPCTDFEPNVNCKVKYFKL